MLIIIHTLMKTVTKSRRVVYTFTVVSVLTTKMFVFPGTLFFFFIIDIYDVALSQPTSSYLTVCLRQFDIYTNGTRYRYLVFNNVPDAAVNRSIMFYYDLYTLEYSQRFDTFNVF